MEPGAQSAMVMQETLQRSVIVSQLNGAQLVITAPSTHIPLLHCRLRMAACFVEQLGTPHEVPSGGTAQLPAPSQVPFLPQGLLAITAQPMSAVPAGTAAQVPSLPFTPQLLHVPQLSMPQQNPSVQWWLAQSASAPQAAPFAAGPLHTPAWQVPPPPHPDPVG